MTDGSGNIDGVASNNVAITTQTATARDNWSSTAQQGDGNRAEIRQSGVGERVSASRAYEDYRNNEPPEADVWQLSNDNRAYIDQASDASRVTIYQGLEQTPLYTGNYDYSVGGNNVASVTQSASADSSRADVIQGGSNNTAYVTQDGFSSLSNINQTGTGQQAYVTQSSADNNSFVVQAGSNNYASVTQ